MLYYDADVHIFEGFKINLFSIVELYFAQGFSCLLQRGRSYAFVQGQAKEKDVSVQTTMFLFLLSEK